MQGSITPVSMKSPFVFVRILSRYVADAAVPYIFTDKPKETNRSSKSFDSFDIFFKIYVETTYNYYFVIVFRTEY